MMKQSTLENKPKWVKLRNVTLYNRDLYNRDGWELILALVEVNVLLIPDYNHDSRPITHQCNHSLIST